MEDSHNAHTTAITMSSVVFSAAVFPAFWEQARIGAHFAGSVQSIPLITLQYKVPLVNE
jgi:hypothetical protein